jgi:hypothetical protein
VCDDARVIEATRFGRPLPEGGCIGVPAPASPWESRSDLLRGVEWWQARGYRVKLADGIEARDSYVAGDPRAGPATWRPCSPTPRSTSSSA